MSGQTQTAAELTSSDQLDVIFDADAHVAESVDILLPYMEDKASKRIISQAKNPVFEIYSLQIGGIQHGGTSYYNQEAKVEGTGGDQFQKKIDDMDDFDIDYGLLGPTLNATLGTVNNDRYAAALSQAYNSWMAAEFFDRDERVLPSIVVAGQVPHKAAEEIDKYGSDNSLKAVQLPPSSQLPPIGHETYDPIYRAAQDHDLPLVLHVGVPIFEFPNVAKYAPDHLDWHVTMLPFSMMHQYSSLVLSGVPERFPDLEFVFAEAGIGWVPFIHGRMDNIYLEEGHLAPALDRLPSEYAEDRFYFTTQPVEHMEPERYVNLLEMVGTGSILFSSDLPHPDFDTPDELFDRINPYLSEDEVRGIMGETAASLFGIDL